MNKGRRVLHRPSGRPGVVVKSMGNCLWVKMDDDGTEWSGARQYWRPEPKPKQKPKGEK